MTDQSHMHDKGGYINTLYMSKSKQMGGHILSTCTYTSTGRKYTRCNNIAPI